jgi:hypothetical protein
MPQAACGGARTLWRPFLGLGMKAACEGDQLHLVLHHPRDCAVEPVLRSQPRAASGVVSSVGVAVIDDAAEFRAREHVAKGRGTRPADLPHSEGARCSWHRQEVRWDGAAQDLRCRLTSPSDAHVGGRYEPPPTPTCRSCSSTRPDARLRRIIPPRWSHGGWWLGRLSDLIRRAVASCPPASDPVVKGPNRRGFPREFRLALCRGQGRPCPVQPG